MEEKDEEQAQRSASAGIHLANALIILVPVIIAYTPSESGSDALFIIGCIWAGINLAGMLWFMIKKDDSACVSNIVWLVLVPLITGACYFISILPHGKVGG